jgi:hypothetical protein
MSTDIMAFDNSLLPSYMQEAFQGGEMEQTLQQRNSLNQLTFKGKVWRAIVNGEEHIQTNTDGDPLSTIKVVILKTNPARSRAYYEGEFKEGENRAPTCWSADGKVPDKEVPEPMCGGCADCPMAAKGSRISNSGKPAVACTSFKNLVVIPITDLNFPALRLRLPQTSIWDKATEGAQWMAYDQYVDYLRGKAIPNLAVVVTKIKFDPDMAYPKLIFSPDFDHDDKTKAFLTKEEFNVVKERLKDEDFGVLLGTTPLVSNNANATPKLAAPVTPVAALDTPAPAQKAEPKLEVVQEAKPEVVEAKVEAAPAVKPAVSEGLANLVDSWDD